MMTMIMSVIHFMHGDYDEWRANGGDIDSLMDELGY